MYGLFNLKDKMRKYLAFDESELKNFIIIVLLLSFIVAFDDGKAEFSAAHWGINYILVMLLVLPAVFVHVVIQRIFALEYGYKPKLKLSWYMLVIGIILTVISAGKFWFFLVPGVFVMDVMEVHRLGYFRYGLSMRQFGWIAAMGCLANIFLAMIFKALLVFNPQSLMLQMGVSVNIAMAIMNILPIPPLNGSKLFFGSRLLYFFMLGIIVGMAVFLLVMDSILLSLLFSLILGVIAIFAANEYLE